MKKLLHQGLLITLAVAAVPVWASQKLTGLAKAFGTPSQQSAFVLSPDGSEVAWRQRNGADVGVVIYDLKTHAVLHTLSAGKSLAVDWLGWEDDDTLLMETSFTSRLPSGGSRGWQGQAIRWRRVMAVNVASGKARLLLAHRLQSAAGGVDTGAQLIAYDIPQPHTAIMAALQWSAADYRPATGTMIHDAVADSGDVSTLFSVDTRTGHGTPIATGDAFTSQWVVDAEGKLVARSEWHAQDQRYSIYARQSGKWRRIYRHRGSKPSLVGLDPKAHAILTIIRDAAGTRRLWAIPLDGSAPTRMLPTVSQPVRSVAFSRYSGTPTAVWVGRALPRRIWLDTAAHTRYQSVARAFPGREVRVYDHTRDGKAVMAEVEGSGSPPVYYLVNFATGHAMIAGEAYPQLDHVALVTAHRLRYRMRDGRAVHAQLFLPPGGDKGLSLVVLAPGGPVGDGPAQFDWLAQYLVARGYAVLHPDIPVTYLYSEGGAVRWGGVSQHYAVDGTHRLIQQGVVDARRVCILGIGYGGYAALAGAAFFPHAYACAVSVNGISDLPSLLGHEREVWGGAHSNHAPLAAWRAHIGAQSDAKVIAASPVDAAKDVIAPVLLIHDVKDTVVPVRQSLEMRDALEKLNKPVTFLELQGSDHWLNHGSTRIEVLKAVGGFLAKHLH